MYLMTQTLCRCKKNNDGLVLGKYWLTDKSQLNLWQWKWMSATGSGQTFLCPHKGLSVLQEGGRDWNSVLIIGQPLAHSLNTNLEGWVREEHPLQCVPKIAPCLYATGGKNTKKNIHIREKASCHCQDCLLCFSAGHHWAALTFYLIRGWLQCCCTAWSKKACDN